jgi:hypothetical protein
LRDWRQLQELPYEDHTLKGELLKMKEGEGRIEESADEA